MHLTADVLAVADAQWYLRHEISHGEEISEDAVVLCQSLDLKRTVVLLPGFLHFIQRDFNCWDKEKQTKVFNNH